MEHSEVDSRRFGLRIHRATLPEIREREILAQLLEHEIDVAILRFPTSQQPQISRLERIGVPYIVADTLVYYSADLTQQPARQVRNPGLTFELAGPGDRATLDGLVTEIFDQYANHYSSNPFLPQVDMLAGYCEWARSFCVQGLDGRWAWIVREGGQPVAFVTCAERADGEEVEGVLFGVVPGAEGRGVYGDLIAFSQKFFSARHIPRMVVSTQVQNVAVQKAWTRAGFAPSHSYVTVHLNAFLSHSARPAESFSYTVDPDMTEQYGRLTGDRNPIHFDDGAARAVGFDDRIAHGIAVDAAASRFFGTVWPGPGCLYLNYSYRFLKPVYISRPYEIVVTFPIIDEGRGFAKALVRVVDSEGGVCVLSYHDLRFGLATG